MPLHVTLYFFEIYSAPPIARLPLLLSFTNLRQCAGGMSNITSSLCFAGLYVNIDALGGRSGTGQGKRERKWAGRRAGGITVGGHAGTVTPRDVTAYRDPESSASVAATRLAPQFSARGSTATTCPPIAVAMAVAACFENWGSTKTVLMPRRFAS